MYVNRIYKFSASSLLLLVHFMTNCATYDTAMLSEMSVDKRTVGYKQDSLLFRARGGTSQGSYSEHVSSNAPDRTDDFFEDFVRLVRDVEPFCHIKDLLSRHIRLLNHTYICDGIEYTPLHYAAAANEEELTQYLVDHMSVEPDIRTHNMELTPLQYAALEGHVAVAEYLINAGANSNAKDCQNFTPLHYAVLGGCLRTVELLMVLGADPSARTVRGCNILHISIIHNAIEVINRLIDLLEVRQVNLTCMVNQTADVGYIKTPISLVNSIYGPKSSLALRLTKL